MSAGLRLSESDDTRAQHSRAEQMTRVVGEVWVFGERLGNWRVHLALRLCMTEDYLPKLCMMDE